MKNRLDLTSKRDFDPENFKVNKVESRYYDDSSNSYRTPWNKSGKILRNHRLSYWNSFTNIGWNISWTDSTLGTVSSIDSTNIRDIVEQISTIASYNYVTNLYSTSNYWTSTSLTSSYNSPVISYINENMDDGNFRCGKVRELRRRFKVMKSYSRSYDRYNAYSDVDNHNRIIHDNRKKYRYARKYEGYEGIIECTIGEFREMDAWTKDRSGYILSDFYKSSRKMKSLISQEHNKRKVEWFDRHDDYLRMQMGLRPRHLDDTLLMAT